MKRFAWNTFRFQFPLFKKKNYYYYYFMTDNNVKITNSLCL